ncbi:MAG: hypothetical protein JSS81_05280 [Acidobacteria bacterium]|nr:hypothetical protein [Acidobacteriota bacterium]
MNDAKKTVRKIRVEKTERIVLPKARIQYCDGCRGESIFISVEQATLNFGISFREIFRLVERKIIHFHENSQGLMFVCAASIAGLPKESAIIRKDI